MGYIKKKSAKQEKRTAKEFGGKTTPASGAMWSAKADVRTGDRGTGFNEDDFLIENKFTDADNYKLERKIWEKIATEALRDNFRTPLMQIDVQDLNLIVMDYNTYTEYHDESYILDTKCTNMKSIKLIKEELESLLDATTFRHIVFGEGRTALKLVVMKKKDYMYLTR